MAAFNPQSGIRNPQLRACFCVLFSSLILMDAAAAGEGRPSDAVTVFHCRFGDEWDVNYDRWPDRWERKTGPNYPHYVSMQITEDAAAPGGKVLKAMLDGAAAAVATPPIRVMSRFSYLFEA